MSVTKISAKKIFDAITQNAWRTGDPGIVFIDEINRYNPTRLFEVNKIFEDISRKEKFYSKKLIFKILKSGNVQNLNEVPKKIRQLFVTSRTFQPNGMF